MRLIDADLLKKNIAKWLQGGDPQETQMVKLDDIAVSVVMEIEEQPTAYDVSKVVAELEEIKQDWKMKEQERGLNFMDCVILREYQKHYDKAIDIVRKGGVE